MLYFISQKSWSSNTYCQSTLLFWLTHYAKYHPPGENDDVPKDRRQMQLYVALSTGHHDLSTTASQHTGVMSFLWGADPKCRTQDSWRELKHLLKMLDWGGGEENWLIQGVREAERAGMAVRNEQAGELGNGWHGEQAGWLAQELWSTEQKGISTGANMRKEQKAKLAWEYRTTQGDRTILWRLEGGPG